MQHYLNGMLTKKEIKKIKKMLPKGFIKKISERSNYSESSVEKFFSGTFYNSLIHEAAINEAQENKERIENLKAMSNKL